MAIINPLPPGSLNPDPISTLWRYNNRQKGRDRTLPRALRAWGRGLRCAEDFDGGMHTPGQGDIGCPHDFAGASSGGSASSLGGLRLWQDRAASSPRNKMLTPERPAEASHTHGGASACDWTERLFTPKLGIFFI